ncbi:MAG: DNA-processing protein DprA [Nocardioides sp.]|nr:DNA-processing protein DprA [Nocardioides sp.]
MSARAPDAERIARAALVHLTEPGDLRLARAVTEHGAVLVHEQLRADRDVRGLASDVAERLRVLDPARELEQADALGIRFLVPGDEEWPTGVDDLASSAPVQGRGGAPLGLWVRGPARLDEVATRAVAVVGSRSATSYGASVAGDLAARLAHEGWGVVSGGAFGIDQAAHRGALAASGTTVAVLACGVDRAYPVAHTRLLDFIADHGLLVSELPPGRAVRRERFLTRNRLIAALTKGTVVVEAALRSGALNTANWASALGRPLLGVPGPVTSAPSAGVHQLIRTRDALLVTRGEEVIEALAPMGQALLTDRRGADSPRDALDEVERQVLDALPVRRSAELTAVARTAGMDRARVLGALGRLAEAGFAEQHDAGWRLGELGRAT